jgi:hypothetical protein
MSKFTLLKPKDLINFFGLDSYEAARRVACQIKKQLDTSMLTPSHLAKFLALPVEEVLIGLK